MVKKRIDWILLISTIFLVVFGILMIFVISAPFSQEEFGRTYYFLGHQILFGVLPGIIFGFLAFRINISFLKKMAPLILFLNLIFVSLVFFPKIGFFFGGAKRWVKFGFLSFQPSEFLKITLFLYLAAWLEKRKEKGVLNLVIFLIILSFVASLLLFQPDFSTSAILVFGGILIYFLAETPVWHSLLTILMAGAISFLLIYLAPYRMERFLTFLQPQIDPMGSAYQIKQAQIAIGSGGVFGKGLGMSKQKFGLLPNPTSDSIFAIICEEVGFLGSLILIFLFLIFFQRGFKIGREASDKFSKLTAFGITSWISIQAFFNISSMIGILPLAGIPLPFISYGGSHLVAELIGVGILMNIAKNL